jgi:heme-degrading monooxygenase HmoA
MWSYEVAPENTDLFRDFYGPAGEWVQLFRQADGYIGTELFQARGQSGAFITIDRWESEDALRRFRASHSQEFNRLDEIGQAMTLFETFLGEFQVS